MTPFAPACRVVWPANQRGRWHFAWLAATFAAAVCSGCYDGEALVKQARSAAQYSRLAEFDLGTYHTTLPRESTSAVTTELKLHIFGTVPRYRVPALRQQLERDRYRLRHETLAAIRQTSPEELAEPSLLELRSRIEEVVNGVLADAPVKTIGFYDFKIR